MRYQVVIDTRATRDIDEVSGWIAAHAPDAAERWFNQIEHEVLSLRDFPKRAPLAPENGDFPFELRQHIFGQRRGRYRIIFTIIGTVVHVLHIRHGARKTMTRTEVDALFPSE